MDQKKLDPLDIPTDDRALIDDFVRAVRAWAPTTLKSIVLYGSVAQGVFPDAYDIDIAVLFSRDFDHPQFYSEVYRIIADLAPRRKMHVVLKWEREIEPAYLELMDKEGITLFP
ncbi:MAG TPA: nucleotidyltransferase domain-containing protein [Candidatus Bathyarchaeia archaeon]|nr:nucleotidyltransferase domain-containing protein [Candidatus Bathyarchaeia archaeon]